MDKIEIQVRQDWPLRCLLALPQASASAKPPWPVLCFLHGYDEGAPLGTADALTRHGPLRPGNPAATIGQFIVVAPQMPVRGDLWHRYASPVRQIADDVKHRWRGDARRLYLTGFSYGANGVFDLALEEPGFWAALWAVDPTRIPRRDPQRPLWLSFGAAARAQKSGFIEALRLEPDGGDTGAARICTDTGADHVGCATKAYRDERIYAWLLAQNLE